MEEVRSKYYLTRDCKKSDLKVRNGAGDNSVVESWPSINNCKAKAQIQHHN